MRRSACNGETVAAEKIVGPVKAEVIRVIDGDTIEARAQLWIGLSLISRIRIRGIDTPEMRGGCLAEKTLAAAARDLLAELAGETILITNIENDKYGGRVIADAAGGNGADLGSEMVARGWRVPTTAKRAPTGARWRASAGRRRTVCRTL